MDISLKGKNALIGGSTQGIGFAIAESLANCGATCILISRNEESLKKAVEKLSVKENQKHEYIVADFFDYKEVKEKVEHFLSKKSVQILINNSGGPAAGLIKDAQVEEFLSAFQQHLICNQIITQQVIPGMIESNYGRIINIISTSVKIPLKGLGVSNTIRGAVASWSKTMANELGQYGITVNNILPGATGTQRLSSIIENKARKSGAEIDKVEKEMMEEIPMKRFAKPEEVAAAAVFLASPAASYITG